MKQLDGLVKPKLWLLCLVSALGLKDYTDRIYFCATTHMLSRWFSYARSPRPNVWSIEIAGP